MDIHNTEELKNATPKNKPSDYPAVLNVSDPCVDVYYLLCVDVKTVF